MTENESEMLFEKTQSFITQTLGSAPFMSTRGHPTATWPDDKVMLLLHYPPVTIPVYMDVELLDEPVQMGRALAIIAWGAEHGVGLRVWRDETCLYLSPELTQSAANDERG